MNNKKLVVIFPGIRYSADCPLLYYAGFKYENRGYEKLVIDYMDLFKQKKPIEEYFENIKKTGIIQLQALDLSDYDDIVFVSKSIGTVIAGWIDEKLCIKAKHIILTPINETLPYIKREKNIKIVIAGTNDKYLGADILKKQCIKENICLKQIDGAGHRLEVNDDIDKNIEILKEVVDLY